MIDEGSRRWRFHQVGLWKQESFLVPDFLSEWLSLTRNKLVSLVVYCWRANAWHPRHPSCLDTLFGRIGFLF